MISFSGKQFPKDIILMAERNVKVDHATLQRWVVEYSPQLEQAFRKNYKNKTNCSWRMDETYLKIKGKDIVTPCMTAF